MGRKKTASKKTATKKTVRKKSADKKVIHIISNTHWDREWAYPFQETRLLLVEFMDNLLTLLEERPDYHSFLMDSQTLCVEDYLDLVPEDRERIEKQVKAGRLIVGPWYSLPEEYLVNGESLVRNLLVGHRVAGSLGKISKLGYTPFSYGQTSQMPQIYNGFDIDTMIFYRGINTKKAEFLMEGPDGSQLFGMRFGCLSRFSYYFYLYRNVVQGMTRDEWWYSWDKGARPFRLCNEDNPLAHYYIMDPSKKMFRKSIIPKMLEKLVTDESEHFSTEHIACMNGFDSSEPDFKELDLLEACRAVAPKNVTLKQTDLKSYMDELRKTMKGRKPETIYGESRDPGATGKWTHLFGDVISSRPRIKRHNHDAETAVQRWAEPFAALGMLVGGNYPKSAIDLAWKYILQNHPHDTICGAGVDQMQKDLHYRFDQSIMISKGVARRGLQEIAKRIDTSDIDCKDSIITIFNPCPYERNEVVTAYVDLPELPDGHDPSQAFIIRDEKGNEVARQERTRYPFGTLVRNLQDISLEQRATRVLCTFPVKKIPGLGYKTYHITFEELDSPRIGSMAPERNTMENEHLLVTINDNGTVDILHKETGAVFDTLHYLEDCGETGHSWVHMSPEHDEVFTSMGFPVKIALVEDGPLMVRYEVTYMMEVPAGLSQQPDGVHRSKDLVPMTVKSVMTLRQGQKFLHIKTSCNNIAEFHRLRAVFPTRLATDKTSAEAAFDVIDRPIEVKPDTVYYGKPNPYYPNHRFMDISDGEQGIALLNNGIREFEAVPSPEREVALTLLRAFEFKQSPVIDQWDIHPEMKLAQCPGEHDWSYAIYPHAGNWQEAGVYEQAEIFTLPLELGQAGPGPGNLPKSMSFIRVEPKDLIMSTMKRCEERDSLILRLYNPTGKNISGKVRLFEKPKEAWLTNLNEERREELKVTGKSVNLSVAKKKIVTLELVF